MEVGFWPVGVQRSVSRVFYVCFWLTFFVHVSFTIFIPRQVCCLCVFLFSDCCLDQLRVQVFPVIENLF